MKADLKFKAVWWNSFLFYWALIFLLFALVAAAADFFNRQADALGGAGRVRRGKNGASAGGVFSDERNRHGDAGISGSGQSGAGLRCVLAACRFGIKTLGIVKPGCFFVRTENVYEWRTGTGGERVL